MKLKSQDPLRGSLTRPWKGPSNVFTWSYLFLWNLQRNLYSQVVRPLSLPMLISMYFFCLFLADVRVAVNKRNMVALEMYHPSPLQERTCISTVGNVVRRYFLTISSLGVYFRCKETPCLKSHRSQGSLLLQWLGKERYEGPGTSSQCLNILWQVLLFLGLSYHKLCTGLLSLLP